MQLPDPAPVFITVARNQFILRIYRTRHGYVAMNEYPIATGVAGRKTPIGEYRVVAKSTEPDWKAPPWADGFAPDGSEIAGQTFEFADPRNPFAGGFISLDDGNDANENSGIGIHGTKFDPLVGTHASHGCIRMRTPDLERIYDQVPIGAVVVIF